MSRSKQWIAQLTSSPSGTLNRDLRLIFASNFVGAFEDGLFAYIWPLYIRALEADPTEVGVVFSVISFGTA